VRQRHQDSHVKLVAFDLDGTLIRRDTVALALARSLGWAEQMETYEGLTDLAAIANAREEMARWYQTVSLVDLCACLESIPLAPGAEAGIQLLKQHGITVAIVSLMWEFAVAWYAQRLGADCWAGTVLAPSGHITHLWPDDKARWLLATAHGLGLTPGQVAAVGDSWGDIELLQAAGHAFFVGPDKPPHVDHVVHVPDGNLFDVAHRILTISE
jgi:HAD superfamily phosphoserine phosphatase-like hydrolase